MIDKIVERLNEVLEIDYDLVSNMFYAEFDAKEELADHPSVQVSYLQGKYTVRLLGLLNGVIDAGVDSDYIAMVIHDQKILKFIKLGKDYFKETR